MTRDKSLPFMQLAVDNLLVGLMTMTDAEAGRYVRLLCLAWAKGPLNRRAANAASPIDHNGPGVDEMLASKFVKEGDVWSHTKIEKDFAKQLAKVEGGRRGGIESARARQASAEASTEASTEASAKESESESEIQSQAESNQYSIDPADRRFDAFWEVVHRKQGKRAARVAFEKSIARVKVERKISLDKAASMLRTAMFNFAGSSDGRDDVRGTLHPATWLNQGRYDDDQELWDGKRAGRTPTVVKKVAAKLTIDNVRWELLKTHNVQESRKWDDARCIAEHKKLTKGKR